VGADFLGLLDDGDVERLAGRLGELGELDRAAQAGRPGADEEDVGLQDFVIGHAESILGQPSGSVHKVNGQLALQRLQLIDRSAQAVRAGGGVGRGALRDFSERIQGRPPSSSAMNSQSRAEGSSNSMPARVQPGKRSEGLAWRIRALKSSLL